MMVVIEGGTTVFPTVSAPEEDDESYGGVTFGHGPDEGPSEETTATFYPTDPEPDYYDTPPAGGSPISIDPAQGIGPEPPGWVGPDLLGAEVLSTGGAGRGAASPVRRMTPAARTLSPAVDLSNACACGDGNACLDLVSLLIDEGASLEAAQDMVARLAASPCGGATVATFKRLPWWAWAAIVVVGYVAWEGIR